MPSRSHPIRPLAPAGLLLVALLGACDRSTPRLDVTTAPASPTQATAPSATPETSPLPAPPVPLVAAGAAAPRVVRLDPPDGATGVDPRRPTLAVTFDRAMQPEGWSWVIETPETAPELGEASFDPTARTNTVAARLEPGRSYVVWINSPHYDYFRSAEGVPATPVRWTFSTAGERVIAAADPAAAAPVHGAPPRIARLDPPNGATDVAPGERVLRATFDRPMEASWSWVTEGRDFPEATGKAYFEPDAMTAAMPVRLEPGRTYVVWLNSAQYQLFRDRAGVPAPPLRWTFSTRPAR
jgi:RNA polymerase sigma-70 factor (ECF subfamily)